MKNVWLPFIIMVQDFPVKVYVDLYNERAIIFPLFGKYFSVRSDVNALDFATSLLLHKLGAQHNCDIKYDSYLGMTEDTQVIELDKVG